MVKNSGGNKTKGAARKFLTNRPSSKLRKSESEEEKYAYTTKICGGRICHVKTICGIELTCHIRGKFSGRNKSSNLISVGSLLLVGVREFGKLECDVIEVYNPHEVELLKQMPDVDLSEMHRYANPFRTGNTTITEDYDISDAVDFRRTRGEESKEDSKEENNIVLETIEESGEIINIDDI